MILVKKPASTDAGFFDTVFSLFTILCRNRCLPVFDGGIPKGYVFGSENTWERSDLTVGPKSALVLPSAAKVIDRNVEWIGGQLLHDLMRIAHACLESPEARLRQVFVVESLAAS
jgi:hypothetical protein